MKLASRKRALLALVLCTAALLAIMAVSLAMIRVLTPHVAAPELSEEDVSA